MDPLFHTQAGDLLYMRKLVNDSSLWNLSLGDWFHNGTTDGFLPMGIKVTIVIVYSIVCIVGLVGNCSVMYVIIRAFVDALSLCEEPMKLHASELNRDQYLGRWLFIAAASSSPSSLRTFTSADSTLFSMTQSNDPQRLQLQAAIRLKTGQCVPRSWIYLLKEGSADLTTEGRPYMKTELFSAKCPDSIIVQETDQGYQRILLYSRVLHPAEECIKDFKNKAACLDMEEFLLIPRTQDACEFQDV